MNVAFFMSDHPRSKRTMRHVTRALRNFYREKDVRIVYEEGYEGVCSDIAVFYGLKGNLKRVMSDYALAGKTAILIDLGYWRREEPYDKSSGYHRISINSYHPWRIINRFDFPGNRFKALDVKKYPPRNGGGHILLAGMSGKAAGLYGFEAEEWERNAITQIRKHTRRPIIYRPKPSWTDAKPIKGIEVTYSAPGEPLRDVLKPAWAVVTHHSNVSIDGQLLGIPSFCDDGAARCISLQDLAMIEEPRRIDEEERDQFMFNLAYFQWHTSEMSDGTMWRFLLENGLVPR